MHDFCLLMTIFTVFPCRIFVVLLHASAFLQLSMFKVIEVVFFFPDMSPCGCKLTFVSVLFVSQWTIRYVSV